MSKRGRAYKTGLSALALLFLGENTAAGADCARPEEMTALRVAALRQELMVAALACRQAPSFNLFVTAYEAELQNSDRTLLELFQRRDAARGDGNYNAYKTRLANASSLRSRHDPQFCFEAAQALEAAVERHAPLEELVFYQSGPVDTGFSTCGLSDIADAPSATQDFPARHAEPLPPAVSVTNAEPATP